MEDLKTIVNGTKAKISHVFQGKIYYEIKTNTSLYQLEIDSLAFEFQTTYLEAEIKAITLMRWIRKGMDDGSFIKISE
jgi:hypothetical protein